MIEVILRLILTLALAGGVSTPDGDSSPKPEPASAAAEGDTRFVAPAFVPAVPAPVDSGSERTSAAALRGLATWYDAPSKQDAAAGPNLRRALGSDWRGSWVRVSYVGGGQVQAVVTRLTDFCACGPRNGQPTLLDLDDQAFADLAPLGSGVIRVSVEAIQGVPTVLPATDTGG